MDMGRKSQGVSKTNMRMDGLEDMHQLCNTLFQTHHRFATYAPLHLEFLKPFPQFSHLSKFGQEGLKKAHSYLGAARSEPRGAIEDFRDPQTYDGTGNER